MKRSMFGGAMAALLLAAVPAAAQAQNAPGVTDTEIKIGNTVAYSGPAAPASTTAKTMAAYFNMINEQGGINGRKIKFISLDDGYSPPKTVELTRKLVEQEHVAFMLGSLGAAPQLAVQRYLNEHKVPSLFIASGAMQFYEPKKWPWSMAFQPSYYTEGRLVGKEITTSDPHAKIALLIQNDDFGHDYLRGLKETIGKGVKITGVATFEVTDPTLVSQINTLKATGAGTLIVVAQQRQGALGIREAYDSGWKPHVIIPSVIGSIGAVLRPAGLKKSVGVVTATYMKDPFDPRWKDDPATQEYVAFMKKYNSSVNMADSFAATSYYSVAKLMVDILKDCGNDLSRENIMKHATSLHDVHPAMALPGVVVNTSPTDYRVVKQMQFERFDGKEWKLFGPLFSEQD